MLCLLLLPRAVYCHFLIQSTRDLVLEVGTLVDGPIQLHFHAWEVDRFGHRANIPFLLKLSTEGIPQHAWYDDIAQNTLCDEALIHHVEEASNRRIDQRVYVCWAFTQDPLRIPQTVFLTFDWVSTLWCRMVNGEPGRHILHCICVRQGDPLSPMLFLLPME